MALVGKWSLAEDNYSGGVFQDLTANNNDGTPDNAPAFIANQQSRAGRALAFVAANTDVITISDPVGGELDFGTGSFSLVCWVKLTATNIDYFFLDKRGGSNPGWELRYDGASSGKFVLVVDGGGAAGIAESLGSHSVDTWYSIVGLRDGTDLKIYVDKVIGTNGSESGSVDTASDLYIGANAGSVSPLDGGMNNVELYNHALTLAEITNIHDSELFWDPQLFTGEMNFSGSISAQNPNWLLLDNSLGWRGEWDETVTYELDDAVLYKTGNGEEFHVFVSKTSHNTGNNPTTSPTYWRRYYQEQFI